MLLVEKEKHLNSTEDDVNALSRRIVLMELESKEAETRMGETVKNLALKSKEADAIVKKVGSGPVHKRCLWNPKWVQ